MTFRIRALHVTLMFVATSHAADFVVVTNSDSGPGSLRQAILDANAGGGGTITFSHVTGTIAPKYGLPALTANITISGPGLSELTVSNFVQNLLTNSPGNNATLIGVAFRGTVVNQGTMTAIETRFGGRDVGPGIYNSGAMTLNQCAISGRNTDGPTAIENYGSISVDHCTITNNQGGSDVFNSGTFTMDNSVVSGHSFFSSSSGGILNSGGFVVLRNCSISHNDSVEGGGVWNGGSLAVTNCLISYNSAHYSEQGEVGGGLYNIGYAILQNTTISGNYAQGAGGGIWNSGSMRLLNCTVTSNNAIHVANMPFGGAGIWTDGRAISQSKNSIIANNNSYDTNHTLIPDDIGGYLQSLGHNLVGVDPMLGPLQDNGGPTWTHALLQSSPAIDAGDPTGAPADDQRGVPRPQGLGFDIGAFEFRFPAIPVFAPVQIQSKTNLFLKAFGFPSTSYALQASQDFISWDTIANVTAPSNGVLQFTDPIAGPKRFFRLKSQSP